MTRRPSVKDLTAFFEDKSKSTDEELKQRAPKRSFITRRSSLQDTTSSYSTQQSVIRVNTVLKRAASVSEEPPHYESRYKQSRDQVCVQYLPPQQKCEVRTIQPKDQRQFHNSGAEKFIDSSNPLQCVANQDHPLSPDTKQIDPFDEDFLSILDPLTNIIEKAMLSQISEDSTDSPMFGANVKSVKDAVSNMEANMKKTNVAPNSPDRRKVSCL